MPIVFIFYILFFLSFIINAEEILVYFDDDAKIQVIEADLERKLNLFPDVKNFKEARLFRTGTNEYTLEILYINDGNIVRKKELLDEKALSELSQKINTRISVLNAKPATDQEGRYTLLVSSTLYSLSLYGPLAVNIFDIDSAKNIIALESIAGSAGFFLPFWLTSKREITEASAYSYIYGTLTGAFHGFATSLMIKGDDIGSDKLAPSLALGLSLAEGIGGAYLAYRHKLPTGRVDLMGTGFLWSTIWTFEIMMIATEMNNPNAAGAVMTAGSLGGACLGYYISDIENYSRGDAIVQNAVMILGAYAPLAIADIAGAENEKVFTGSTLAGSLIGAAAGYYLVKGRNFSTGQAGLIMLGEAAGGLLGFGAAKYFSEDTGLQLSLSSAGAILGFAAMYYIFHDKAFSFSEGDRFSVNFLPYGMIGSLFNKSTPDYMTGRNHRNNSVPILIFEYKLF